MTEVSNSHAKSLFLIKETLAFILCIRTFDHVLLVFSLIKINSIMITAIIITKINFYDRGIIIYCMVY